MSTLATLSNDLSAAVESAARCVVAVLGGRRRTSSGIHWRAGIIVTADHTLDRDDDIEVILPDGNRAGAALAGRDPSTDLAVLKLSATQTDVAEKSDGRDLRVGHVVLAIARSGKEGPSATMGVLSALDEAWTTWRGGRIDRFIRADINTYPGFSGGPLVDVSGRIVGINTSGLSRHWSLTLPVSTVDRVTDALLSKGRIARGYLGIGLQPVRIPDTLVRTLGLKRGGGAIVVAVEPGSPADKGGLFIGDVLVALNGAPVTDVDDIHALLGPERVGEAIGVGVVRAGGLAEVRVTVGERPDSDE